MLRQSGRPSSIKQWWWDKQAGMESMAEAGGGKSSARTAAEDLTALFFTMYKILGHNTRLPISLECGIVT